MEKLENENVSLEFHVQSLIKEHKNIKVEYQKLFDSIKKTRTQTYIEINELVENVNENTYAYRDVRSQNQDLLIAISELKTKLKMLKRTNKKTKVTSQMNVVKNKDYVENVDVKNALKAKIDVLCVSCDTDNVVDYMIASSPVCLMSKATSIKSWLWHRKLSHRNFGTVNHLTKQDLVDGLLKFKYEKDHLCSACEQGKSKKVSLQPRLVPSTHSKLELIHMDMCGPMRMESINGKKYILVIVDDYSHYAWAYFIRTKDEAPDMITKFIAHV
ncbi:integrase, catalytic region, zinc finger, CCHC-type containing protein [Tanacetum coccineum]|uniref:Integrase, catalytic region, zinc finger, CCHC-type containing protein n=1 Tax=Tanacetum coccineum TaxID=301880 RepID=A0ABQ5FDV7_9ASTR